MGGRGASSGISDSGKVYGTEYITLHQSGNIKFVKRNEGSTTAPLETMTKGRVYVTLNDNNVPMYISYYDNDNKRMKTIDLEHKHNKFQPHTHHGYFHNENDSEKGFSKLTGDEKKMVDRIKKIWQNYNNGK